jgi:hypothetical protein
LIEAYFRFFYAEAQIPFGSAFIQKGSGAFRASLRFREMPSLKKAFDCVEFASGRRPEFMAG